MDSESSSPVTITSHIPVTCSHEESWRSLPSPFPLGPLDQLVAPFIPVAVVFVYPQPPDHPSIIPTPRLKEAIERVLDYYPHLTGRLEIKDGRHQLHDLGTGAELLEATSHIPLSSCTTDGEVSLLKLPGGGNDLLAPFDMDLKAVCEGPVFTIQHTKFACGGVALGVRVLHTINDAGGFFKLVSDLAEVYRSLPSSWSLTSPPSVSEMGKLSSPPDTKPLLVDFVSTATEDELASAKSYQPTLYHFESDGETVSPKSTSTSTSDEPPPTQASSTNHTASDSDLPTGTGEHDTPAPNTGRVLRFTTAQLSQIKRQATDPDAGAGDFVSTFDALNAFLHQRIYQARHRLHAARPGLPPLSHPDLLSPVDVRRPLGLQGYTGNAVFTTHFPFSPTDLLDGPLPPLARRVHAMTRQSGVSDPESIKSTIKWLAAHQSSSGSGSDSRSKIGNGFRYSNTSLMMSQWNKIDIYSLSIFDEGISPTLVAPPFTPISLLDGLGYYLPTPPSHDHLPTASTSSTATSDQLEPGSNEAGDQGVGGIDVYLSLCDDVWAALDVSVK